MLLCIVLLLQKFVKKIFYLAVQPPLVSGASGAAGKGSALMLARTPAGYALKAAGTINQASRQANAEM